MLQVENLWISEENHQPCTASLCRAAVSLVFPDISLQVLGVQVRATPPPLLPSFTMPTLRHFWKRQYWQRLRLLLSTGQFLLARHTYLAFFCTVRCGEARANNQPPSTINHLIFDWFNLISLFPPSLSLSSFPIKEWKQKLAGQILITR